MNTGASPSGWFPDPNGRFEYRYWNGERWTADVSVHGQRYIDPPQQTPFQQYPPSGGTWAKKPGRGFAITSFITALGGVLIGWIPFICVLGAAATIAAVVFGVLGIRAARRNDGHGRGFAIAGLSIAPVAAIACAVGFVLSVVVVRDINRYNRPGAYTLTTGQCTTQNGLASFTGTIRNDESNTRSYTIFVEFDSQGVAVDSVHTTVDDVAPAATSKWTAQTQLFSSAEVTCRVTTVRGPFPFGIPIDQGN